MSIIIVFSIGNRIVVFEARNCREVTIPSVPGKEEETLPSYTKCSYIPKRMKKQEEAGLLVGSIDRNEDLLSFKFME